MKKFYWEFSNLLWSIFPLFVWTGLVILIVLSVTHMKQDIERYEKMVSICKQMVAEETMPIEDQTEEIKRALFFLKDYVERREILRKLNARKTWEKEVKVGM